MSNTIYPMPFPYQLKDGRMVINEKCACGAFRTEHEDSLTPGHGKLERTKCQKFTWVEFVFRASIVKPKGGTNE